MRDLTCDVCKKPFTEFHSSIYKVKLYGRTIRCCSYTCFRKAEKVKAKELPETAIQNLDEVFNR